MPREYVPARGDLVWLSGRRPALVISPRAYNKKVGLALFCPITSKIKGYPFEVELPEGSGIGGAILSDQIKSLDWVSRDAKRLGTVSDSVLSEVLAKILTLVESE